jgi:hypothetical protein
MKTKKSKSNDKSKRRFPSGMTTKKATARGPAQGRLFGNDNQKSNGSGQALRE